MRNTHLFILAKLFTLAFLFSLATGFAQTKGTVFHFLPATKPGESLLFHTAYAIDFDKQHGIARWTGYLLSREMTHNKVAPRSNDFRIDPQAGSFSPQPCAYRRSGYDRGHLVPAADMAFSAEAMSESFYMTNMTPQKPSFNRGIWKRLEDQVRKWAGEYDTLYVVSGPVMDSVMEKLSSCGPAVSIPNMFFKAVMSKKHGSEKAIGFLIPNEGSKAELVSFAVPIDWVEYCTKLDLFHELPDSIEDQVEKSFDLKEWVQ